MMICFPDMDSLVQIENSYEYELVIENQNIFTKMVSDIANQIAGAEGQSVLSIDNVPVEWSKYADIIVQIVPFDVNKKPLLNKILQDLVKESTNEYNCLFASDVLSKIEMLIEQLYADKPCGLCLNKLSVESVLKAVGIQIDSSNQTDIDKICDYMNLVREFEGEKLFIFVNMRSYFSDEEMEEFITTVLGHDLRVLLLESTERSELKRTRRVIIDRDLCEF